MIELYIEGEKIELTDDIELSFNYETIDPNKLSSIKNSFSKTINVQGTPKNNITFGHIFRNDKYIGVPQFTPIEDNYDPHRRVNWIINKNGFVVNFGYCTLDNIIKKENEITYQLTLYGGIGEFFYSLNYTEDGKTKNLASLFYDWKPKTNLNGYGTAMTEWEENNNIIMKCSSEIIAQSYHNLNPFYTYSGTTEIDKDIVFVPCYNGYYENFDSSHLLVNTKNNNIYPTQYISNENRAKLNNAFPNIKYDYSEDPTSPTTYSALNVNMGTSGNTYGLVNLSRDLDPSEAGELRINEMPVAIRLSKLMAAISNPINNGNYTVDWDNDITDSEYWRYGWIILGKIRQDKNIVPLVNITKNTSYDNQPFSFTYNMATNTTTGISGATFNPYNYVLDSSVLNRGSYSLKYYIKPSFTIQSGNLSPTETQFIRLISGGYKKYNNNGVNIWNTLTRVTRIYDNTNLIRVQADIFYIKSDELSDKFNYGNTVENPYNYTNIPDRLKRTMAIKLSSYLSTSTGTTININAKDVFVHNCNYTIDSITNMSAPWPTATSTTKYYTEIKSFCDSQKINVNFNLNVDATNLSISVNDYITWSMWEYDSTIDLCSSGIWGDDQPITYLSSLPTNQFSFFSNTNLKDYPWFYPVQGTTENGFTICENLDETRKNAITSSKSAGYNIIDLYKKTLFADSATPFKYFADFCKLMNYKIICDNTQRKIYVKKLKNYYVDEIIDINNKVDYNRLINIKTILTNDKIINIGLKSKETYPIQIFNKNSKEKFNYKKFDTGIDFNYSTENLLENLIYENSTDWQMSSVYYNNNPQFSKAYNTPSISWTLFNIDPVTDEMKKKDFFTVGVPSTNQNMIENNDFLPKIAMFDKDNKTVDVTNTFVFLNGFIRNYDYSLAYTEQASLGEIDHYTISPRLMLTNDTYEQYYFNGNRCYFYPFNYNFSFTGWGCYDGETGSASWVLPFFSRDLYNTFDNSNNIWQQNNYNLASWNIIEQENLDSFYSFNEEYTDFIEDPTFNYSLTTTTLSSILDNEYNVNNIPIDSTNTRIYDLYWSNYLDEMFNRNTRELTLHVDLSTIGSNVNELMRKIYNYDGHLWIIRKIENYKLADIVNDKFTKITMHKIINKNNWVN